jgi:hypothetical protein
MRASVVASALCTLLVAHAAQAQPACEPEGSPRCRFIAHCLKPAPPPKKGPGMEPSTQEGCSCVWGILERAFPPEEHARVAAFFEAKSSAGRIKVFPDVSKFKAFV